MNKMAPDKDESITFDPKIESELFALLNTIFNLYEKYQKGSGQNRQAIKR